MARGQTYELAVGLDETDRMPDTARITYTFDDGETLTEPLRADAKNRLFRGRLEAVDRSFSFTVAAGDDRTAPRQVVAVPPPVLGDLAISITPPPYTGLPQETLAPGLTQVQAVYGSQVDGQRHRQQAARPGLPRPHPRRRERRPRHPQPRWPHRLQPP